MYNILTKIHGQFIQGSTQADKRSRLQFVDIDRFACRHGMRCRDVRGWCVPGDYFKFHLNQKSTYSMGTQSNVICADFVKRL